MSHVSIIHTQDGVICTVRTSFDCNCHTAGLCRAASCQRELMRSGGLSVLASFSNSSDVRLRSAVSFALQSCEPDSKMADAGVCFAMDGAPIFQSFIDPALPKPTAMRTYGPDPTRPNA